VHDLSGPFFIIGCTYICSNGHVYASTDAAVRRELPVALEREFPARLVSDAGVGPEVWNWQARGVSRALWNLVLRALRAGIRQDVVLQLLRDVQQGLPGSIDGAREEWPPVPMDDEEREEKTAHPSATQAFNDAWIAYSVAAIPDDVNTLSATLRYNHLPPQGLVSPSSVVVSAEPVPSDSRAFPLPVTAGDDVHWRFQVPSSTAESVIDPAMVRHLIHRNSIFCSSERTSTEIRGKYSEALGQICSIPSEPRPLTVGWTDREEGVPFNHIS
jgi:hypothetical protein